MVDAVQLTQRLVQCASVTPEDDGAQDVLIEVLGALGFEHVDYSQHGIRNSFFVYHGDLQHPYKAPHLCFGGHTDVVPVGDEAAWSDPPFSGLIKDGNLYGRGACDMKSGIGCFVAAAHRFLDLCEKNADGRAVFNGTISLLITGDEEAEALYGTKAVLEHLKDEGKIPDYALVGEPTNANEAGDEIKPGRRGSLTGELMVEGRQGHVAYPDEANNPVPQMVGLCAALSSMVFDAGHGPFPATNLEITTIDVGNKADNVIPQNARAKFNIRFNSLWTAKTIEDKIRQRLDMTKIPYTLSCRSNAESFLTENAEWYDIVEQAVIKVTGRTPERSTKGGTSDARFFAQYCDVVEYGLVNTSAHKVDEYMPFDAFEPCVQIYEDILKRVHHEKA